MAENDIQRVLRSMAAAPAFTDDLADVADRKDKLARRQRRFAAIIGVAVGCLSIVAVAALVRGDNGGLPISTPTGSAFDRGSVTLPTGATLPEGQLLLATGDILERGSSTSVSLGSTKLEFLGLSPDGSFALASTAKTLPTGITQNQELVSINLGNGQRTSIASVGSLADIGPASWSPDGTAVAYRLTTYSSDPSLSNPQSKPVEDSVCVVVLNGGVPSCPGAAGQVLSFAWSPDSSSLVLSGDESEPVRILDVKSGQVSTLLPVGGTPSVRSAIQSAALGQQVQQFVDPIWSASGAYIAADAVVPSAGSVPIVVRTDGTFVAMGKPNADTQYLAWSPAEDLLAYTTGITPPPTANWGVHLLSPNGQDETLLSTQSSSTPYLFGLAWSPTGQWLATDGPVIRVISVPSGNVSLSFSSPDGRPQSLVEWAA